MTNLSLFQISNDFATLNNLLEINSDDPEFVQTLDNISSAFKEKAVNIAYLIRNLEATADNITEAVIAMGERRNAILGKAERLRKYLIDSMLITDQLKIECPYFAITIRDNPPRVNVIDEERIPFEYFEIPKPLSPKLNKLRIKDDLKQGIIIDGVSLVTDKSLQIKQFIDKKYPLYIIEKLNLLNNKKDTIMSKLKSTNKKVAKKTPAKKAKAKAPAKKKTIGKKK